MTQAIRAMIADYKILLDANVLANYAVCNLYLRLAEKPRLFLPKWSPDILDEVYSTHVNKLNWPKDLADSFQDAVFLEESASAEIIFRQHQQAHKGLKWFFPRSASVIQPH